MVVLIWIVYIFYKFYAYAFLFLNSNVNGFGFNFNVFSLLDYKKVLDFCKLTLNHEGLL